GGCLERAALDPDEAFGIKGNSKRELTALRHCMPIATSEVPPDLAGVPRRNIDPCVVQPCPQASPVSGQPVEVRGLVRIDFLWQRNRLVLGKRLRSHAQSGAEKE